MTDPRQPFKQRTLTSHVRPQKIEEQLTFSLCYLLVYTILVKYIEIDCFAVEQIHYSRIYILFISFMYEFWIQKRKTLWALE